MWQTSRQTACTHNAISAWSARLALSNSATSLPRSAGLRPRGFSRPAENPDLDEKKVSGLTKSQASRFPCSDLQASGLAISPARLLGPQYLERLTGYRPCGSRGLIQSGDDDCQSLFCLQRSLGTSAPTESTTCNTSHRHALPVRDLPPCSRGPCARLACVAAGRRSLCTPEPSAQATNHACGTLFLTPPAPSKPLIHALTAAALGWHHLACRGLAARLCHTPSPASVLLLLLHRRQRPAQQRECAAFVEKRTPGNTAMANTLDVPAVLPIAKSCSAKRRPSQGKPPN